MIIVRPFIQNWRGILVLLIQHGYLIFFKGGGFRFKRSSSESELRNQTIIKGDLLLIFMLVDFSIKEYTLTSTFTKTILN